jgi:AmiR/NasT family two-component response regulator
VIQPVVLSESDHPNEVKLAFELGVHGYFLMPMGKPDLAEIMKMIFHYWANFSAPRVNEYENTATGEEAALKT